TFPELARKKSIRDFFPGLQNRFAILHAQSRPPWLFTCWQEKKRSLSLSKGTVPKQMSLISTDSGSSPE
ncbi:MAG: hypothetical protein II579_08280, partial [Treponema sp.]|nr:hypothetical protein [Treponema sp.]